LKGMLPKHKSGTYILVYRSSLGTFWSPYVHHEWHIIELLRMGMSAT